MSSKKVFPVFDEPVEVRISTEETRGSFCIITQTCLPGGGPPPHRHDNEDEIFTTLEGEFEMFDGERWSPLRQGEYKFMLRGSVHTFRNCGTTEGKILVIATPGGLDQYLEAISPIQMPQDAEQLIEISVGYGISFVAAGAPEPALA